MGYYTRVFCKSKNKPTVSSILSELNSLGFSVNSNLSSTETTSVNWTDFELFYKDGKHPILVELNTINSDGLAEEEIQEFLEAIGKPELFNSKKKKVIKHLNQTQSILCNQLPTSDIDDEGYEVNGELMKIFVAKCDGMIQCDGEGFYSGTEVIVKE